MVSKKGKLSDWKAYNPDRPKPDGPLYLAAWMDELRVTDRELCEAIDVSQPTVSRWRSGARVPRRYAVEDDDQVHDPIVTIARALTKLSGRKVNPADLWTAPRINNHPLRKQK